MTLISRCSMTIEETLQIALDAHRGQKDLDGRPALLHPIAVGLMGSNDTEIMTGFLHDVVEDTALTLEDLCPRRGAGRHGHDGASCPHQRQAPQGAASAELPMWNAECVRNAVSFVMV